MRSLSAFSKVFKAQFKSQLKARVDQYWRQEIPPNLHADVA